MPTDRAALIAEIQRRKREGESYAAISASYGKAATWAGNMVRYRPQPPRDKPTPKVVVAWRLTVAERDAVSALLAEMRRESREDVR